jgi:hypothetical protein
MAVKGPTAKRPSLGPAAPAPPEPLREPEPAGLPPSIAPPGDSPEQRRDRDRAAADLTGEGRIGDPSVTGEELAAMGTLVASRHLMALLARKRKDTERTALLHEVGDLILGLPDAIAARRVLLGMGEVGRIVDIYPLEVVDYVLGRRPSLLAGYGYGPVILNKAELEARTFEVEEPIHIKVPLSLEMRAFALEGGGSPGYCFAPGPPAEYVLELGGPGRFSILVRGEVRRKSLLDRAILTIADGPGGESEW